MNLAGVATDAIGRGDALVAPASRRPTTELEVALRPVRGRDEPASRGAYSFHLGAADRAARLRVLGRDAAGVAYARLRLDTPVAADPGDRFVLRDAGRGATVAGGEVLEVAPPRRSGVDAVGRLARRRTAGADARPALVVIDRGAVRATDLPALAGGPPSSAALADAAIVDAGGWWIAPTIVEGARDTIEAAVAAHHRDHPLERGLPTSAARERIRESLRRARVAADPELVDAVLGALVIAPTLERDGGFLRRPGREAVGADDPVLRRLLSAVDGPTPPTIPELVAAGVPRAAIDAAVRADLVVRIAPALVVSHGFIDRALAAIRDAGATGITVSELRESLGTSRKYAVPLVEHLDASRRTRRDGDRRFARDGG
ncbi:MAG: SelB C-terminal domain-containing protein [Actinomycetota bacterium]